MDIIVIGGGASGMTAAIAAARAGAKVTLFEKNDRVGRKILATGNGRCNFSNQQYPGGEYNKNAEMFVKQAFTVVSPEDTLVFFDELGIYPRYESEGRIYPASEQAASVLDALRLEIERLENIEVINQHWIKGIVPKKGGGFAVVSHRNMRVQADRVIIACGGSAGSQYGCEGDGYALAETLQHEVIEPKPALVQLLCKEDYFKQLKGVRAKGAVTLLMADQAGAEETEAGTERGEIQFTETGISGICVFNLSGKAARGLHEKKRCSMVLDLFPELDKDDFEKMMERRLRFSQSKTAEDFLNGLVNKKLIPIVLRTCGVNKMTAPANEITSEQLAGIANFLKHWRVEITETKSWADAQTTSGGVSLSQINPVTMESRLLPGLYFAGEVLDVDGKCGGYNLQWAWSSGMIAGQTAAEQKNA